jgi:uncharacterized membrane protein YadS
MGDRAPIECPTCGLLNPGDNTRCDCGYDFQSRTMPSREKPQMKRSIPYVLVLFVVVAWFWFSKFYPLSSPNPGEAFGRDLASVGLPGLLLWFAARELSRELKKYGAIAPHKLTFGSICGSCALLSILDAFSRSASHRVGAVFMSVLFGVASTVLLSLAYKQQHRVSTTR